MKAKSSFSLKDQLFNADKVGYLSGLIVQAAPNFDAPGFCKTVLAAFPSLELKRFCKSQGHQSLERLGR
ncbi:MAG: hypothetical protein AAFU71_03440 [Cyanobacteria bacterium J06632_22]